MDSLIENEYITCGSCNLKFERIKEYTCCSNCFVCTGCEIYYCPRCDQEIVITPVRPMYNGSKQKTDNSQWRKILIMIKLYTFITRHKEAQYLKTIT